MIESNLKQYTVKLLNNRPVWLTFKLICEETTIPVGWLKALSRGKIDDPGVNRIETLMKYLESKGTK